MTDTKDFILEEANALIQDNIDKWTLQTTFDPFNNELIISTKGNLENGRLYEEIQSILTAFYRPYNFDLNLKKEGVVIKKPCN